MDYGTLIGNSFTYVKEGIIDNVNKWLLLMIATLILTIPLMGYIMNVYRGTKPAPGWIAGENFSWMAFFFSLSGSSMQSL